MPPKQAYEMITKILCEINSPQDMQFILNCLLTRGEILDIIDRVRIYNELINTDHSQRDIASKLGVSINKITRGSANLHDIKVKKFLESKMGQNIATDTNIST